MNFSKKSWIKVFLLGFMIIGFSACSGGGTSNSRAQIPALMSPDSVTGNASAKNNEGVDHLVQGHYETALKYFQESLAAKPNFAEAHFNMAVSLDGMGKHGNATGAFKKAKEYGASNPKIAENSILKKHVM